jgi:hypothetical protein
MSYAVRADESARESKLTDVDDPAISEESARLFYDLGFPDLYFGPVYIEASSALVRLREY